MRSGMFTRLVSMGIFTILLMSSFTATKSEADFKAGDEVSWLASAPFSRDTGISISPCYGVLIDEFHILTAKSCATGLVRRGIRFERNMDKKGSNQAVRARIASSNNFGGLGILVLDKNYRGQEYANIYNNEGIGESARFIHRTVNWSGGATDLGGDDTEMVDVSESGAAWYAGFDPGTQVAMRPVGAYKGKCNLGFGTPLSAIDGKNERVLGILTTPGSCDGKIPSVFTRIAPNRDWIERSRACGDRLMMQIPREGFTRLIGKCRFEAITR